MTPHIHARPRPDARDTATGAGTRDTGRRLLRLVAYLGASLALALTLVPLTTPDTASSGRSLDASGLLPAHAVDASSHNWQVSEASWYGPGFYGRRTACGQTMSDDLVGVAHKSLPCGTLVRFEWHGTEVVAPVVDRGPYVRDREWDLTHGACQRLNRCHTSAIAWTL